jgi:chloramphenicol 3-O phosphotransferase
MSAKIILLNGPSSVGKSTLARALQAALAEPFWHYSIDHLLSANLLPKARIDSGEFPWATLRASFFEGFHRSIPALAEGGNNMIVEHIVETREWMNRLLLLLGKLDVFFLGLHCPLPELERRERERGDRRIGEARADYSTTHTFGDYDFEVNTSDSVDSNASAVIAAWQARTRPNAFERMLAETRGIHGAA